MKRPLLAPWALAALGCLSCSAGEPSHLILISIDTLRADRVGLLGSERDTTPRLDAFFGEGTVFESGASTSPCTIPSVRHYLSGGLALDPERPPLAEALRARGFYTAAVVSQHKYYVDEEAPWDRGFDHFDVQPREQVDLHGMTTRDARQVSDRALRVLESRPDDERLFLWLHYFDPHDPYEPPPAYRSLDAGNRSALGGDRRAYVRSWRQATGASGPAVDGLFSPADVEQFRNLYDGEVQYVDAQIGRVLDALEERGLVERALVILLADHGERLGEEDLWDHCLTLREVEIHVPFLVRDRGGPLAGRARDARPVSTLDAAPTLLAAVGVEPPPGTRGADLRTLGADRPVFAFWRSMQAVRLGAWKLIAVGGEPRALYDLATDPQGLDNQVEARPGLRDELLARVEALGDEARAVAAETRDVVERLRQIGYVE